MDTCIQTVHVDNIIYMYKYICIVYIYTYYVCVHMYVYTYIYIRNVYEMMSPTIDIFPMKASIFFLSVLFGAFSRMVSSHLLIGKFLWEQGTNHQLPLRKTTSCHQPVQDYGKIMARGSFSYCLVLGGSSHLVVKSPASEVPWVDYPIDNWGNL